MNEPRSEHNESGGIGPQDGPAALFLEMVAQYANMALMFLGRVPHPETGQPAHDLETARMFIERLEMLEAKTRGNLNKDEESMLKQSLMAVRMAFVEAVERPPADALPKSEAGSAASPAESDKSKSPTPSAAPTGGQPTEPSPEAQNIAAAEAEARKKFVKRY